jgi:hypothetical protein
LFSDKLKKGLENALGELADTDDEDIYNCGY